MYVSRQKSPITIPASSQEVLEKEWKASRDGILTTHGAQPCTLVALYEPQSRTGYLGHFTVVLARKNEVLEDMVATAGANHPDSKFEAWVGGAALISPTNTIGIRRKNEEIYNEMVAASRGYVIESLQSLNCDLTLDWLNQEEWVLDLVFNTSKGSIMYST